jgi:hypothetical protein
MRRIHKRYIHELRPKMTARVPFPHSHGNSLDAAKHWKPMPSSILPPRSSAYDGIGRQIVQSR